MTQVTPSFIRKAGAGFRVSDCAVTVKSSDACPYRRDTDWKVRTCSWVDFCFCARRLTVPVPVKPVTCASGP